MSINERIHTTSERLWEKASHLGAEDGNSACLGGREKVIIRYGKRDNIHHHRYTLGRLRHCRGSLLVDARFVVESLSGA